MRFRTATASLLIVLAVVSVAWAAEQDVGTPKDKTDSGMTLKKIDDGGPQISEVIAAFEKCFNRGDAKELAALWKPDGYFSGPRRRTHLRPERHRSRLSDILRRTKKLQAETRRRLAGVP